MYQYFIPFFFFKSSCSTLDHQSLFLCFWKLFSFDLHHCNSLSLEYLATTILVCFYEIRFKIKSCLYMWYWTVFVFLFMVYFIQHNDLRVYPWNDRISFCTTLSWSIHLSYISLLFIAIFFCMDILLLAVQLFMDIWIIFCFWLFWLVTLSAFVYKSLYGHMVYLFSIYMGREWIISLHVDTYFYLFWVYKYVCIFILEELGCVIEGYLAF